MTINSDVSKYLKSVVPSWSEKTNPTKTLIKKFVYDINKICDQNTLTQKTKIKPLDRILKLETVIRTCHYIEDIARHRFKSNNLSITNRLNGLKNKEFTWYKSELKNLGIKEEAKETDYKKQIDELVKFVKMHSSLIKKDLKTKDEKGKTPFLRACKDGDLEKMQMLKSLGAKTKIVDTKGNNALHLIMKSEKTLSAQNKKEILEFLLQDGLDINAKNNEGNSPIFEAIINSQPEYVKLLIENCADLTATDNYQDSLIHLACFIGNKEIIEMLLKEKPELINAKDKNGNSPLLIDLQQNKKCAELLIEKGADITITNKKGQTALHSACKHDDTKIVKLLLQKQPELRNTKDKNGNSPLHIAVKKNNEKCAKLLIENGAHVTITNRDKETALHLACANNNRKIIEMLLEKNPELINAKDKNGNSPLFIAIKNNNKKCTKLLIEKDADVTITNRDKETALHKASTKGNKEIVEMLLKEKPELINAKDINGTIPLLKAIENRNAECVKLLIENGADVKFITEKKQTVLHAACLKDNKINLELLFQKKSVLNQKKKEIIELLLQKNPGLINVKDENGDTPLSYALAVGDAECAELLIQKGAEIKIVNNKKSTLLHAACVGGNKKMVEWFLNKMPELINVQNIYGYTPFHIATISKPLDFSRDINHAECANLLIEKGANTNLISNDKRTFLHVACYNGDIKIVETLLQNSRAFLNIKDEHGNTPLLLACARGHFECVDLLIKSDADIDIVDNDKETALHSACFGGNKKIVEMVLEQRPELINAKDCNGNTPLFNAINKGHIKCAKLLIEKRADITIVNNDKETLFHAACRNDPDFEINPIKIIKLLLESNPELNRELINAKDSDGNTPLHTALDELIFGESTDEEINQYINFFIDHGADTGSINNKKETLLHTACKNGLTKTIELLLNKKPELLNAKDSDGNTPLFTALNHNNKESAELLIEHGANVSIVNNDNETTLHLACKYGFFELINEIITRGVNPNAADNRGMTPLYQAIASQDEECAELLIERGAQITDKVTYNGNSIFSILLRYADIPSYRERAKEFLKNKKDVNLQRGDSFGNTPLHYVSKHGLYNLLKHFERNHFFEKNIYYETPIQLAFDTEFLSNSSTEREKFLKRILKNYIQDEKDALESIKNGGIEGLSAYLQKNMKKFLQNVSSKNKNPVEIVLLLNNPNLGQALVKELDEEQFQKYLSILPIEALKFFKDLVRYDINDDHLSVEVVGLPEKPAETEYQLDSLLEIFKELTGYDPESQKASDVLEQKFREFLPKEEIDSNSDKNTPLNELYKRLESFIKNCKNTAKINGIEVGQEKAFWAMVERAITNTIKALKTSKGSEKEVYEKKAQVMREYLNIIGNCATRLDIEFEKLYHLNSGIVRSFKDQIYFQLSERRRQVLESLVPRDDQNVHYIQRMLEKLSKYNIPIRKNPDLFPDKPEALNLEESFKNKYQYNLVTDIKNYLKSDKDMQDMFFQWLEDNKRAQERPSLSQEEISNCLTYIEKHKGMLPQDASALIRDFAKCLESIYGDEYIEAIKDIVPSVLKNVAESVTNPVFLTQDDFEKIINQGNDAFSGLDARLKAAIEQCGFQGKLTEIFKAKSHGNITLTSEQQKNKKKILDKYMEINFPKMVKKVKDKDIKFLLKELKVLKKVAVLPLKKPVVV